MQVFCYECGAKLDDTARFCPECGSPVRQAKDAPDAASTVPVLKAPKCTRCGADLDGAASFCGRCGARADGGTASSAPNGAGSARFSGAAGSVVSSLERMMFSAPNHAGEFVGGSLKTLPGPSGVISGGLRNVISSAKRFFKNPKALIPTLLLSAAWFVLNILKANGTDNTAMRILSTLTFSNAGMGTNVLGAIGGVIGKGVFAGAIVSLIYTVGRIGKGGGRGFGATLKGAFGFDRNTVWSYTAGVGLALMLFVFMSGNADHSSVMGGAAASFLSAKSAVSGGFLSRLLVSFESNSRVKVLGGIPRGMAAGFALASALCFIPNCSTGLLIAGAVIMTAGYIMICLQKAGVIGAGGKEAGTV